MKIGDRVVLNATIDGVDANLVSVQVDGLNESWWVDQGTVTEVDLDTAKANTAKAEDKMLRNK